MCNEYGKRVRYRRYVEEFSHLGLPLVVEGNGPDLTPRDGIRIRDTAPVILRTGDGVLLTERTWAPRAASKKPVFNFRSEGEAQGQMAVHAGRGRVVLHRRADPARRDRCGGVLHDADDRAGPGRCAISRPAGRRASAGGVAGVAGPDAAGSRAAAAVTARLASCRARGCGCSSGISREMTRRQERAVPLAPPLPARGERSICERSPCEAKQIGRGGLATSSDSRLPPPSRLFCVHGSAPS